MGGGASSYRLEAGNGKRAGPRPEWLQSPAQKLGPLGEKDFENLAGIGKGKFGFVYVAKHSGSKKCVAIKYISKQFVYECKSIARINQEITVLQKIDHPPSWCIALGASALRDVLLWSLNIAWAGSSSHT